jgi:hypothetical protein
MFEKEERRNIKKFNLDWYGKAWIQIRSRIENNPDPKKTLIGTVPPGAM